MSEDENDIVFKKNFNIFKYNRIFRRMRILKMINLKKIYNNNMLYTKYIISLYYYQIFPKKIDKRPESKHGRPESSKFLLEKNNLKLFFLILYILYFFINRNE